MEDDIVTWNNWWSWYKFWLRFLLIEQWGFFSVLHILWHGASVYNGHLRGHVKLSGWYWRCHYLFYDLQCRSVAAGIRTISVNFIWWHLILITYSYLYNCTFSDVRTPKALKENTAKWKLNTIKSSRIPSWFIWYMYKYTYLYNTDDLRYNNFRENYDKEKRHKQGNQRENLENQCKSR